MRLFASKSLEESQVEASAYSKLASVRGPLVIGGQTMLAFQKRVGQMHGIRRTFAWVSIVSISTTSISITAPKTPHSGQTVSESTANLKWSETQRKALLAKAQRGDRSSQMWLGAAYEQGWFGKKNFHKALKWFRSAAAQGDPDAQNSLGQMYEDGEGVPQNYVIAAKWYKMAAEHVPDFGGAGQGRNNLGMIFMQGLGVPKDYVQAYMWFRLANFETNLLDAKNHMTPVQVLEAERMAANWKTLHQPR